MRCKETLNDGSVCDSVCKNTSSICWSVYNMCGNCCKQQHPEIYSSGYNSTISHFIRELRKGDPELDEYMSTDVTTTKWTLGDK